MLLCLCYVCGCSITSDDLSSSNQVLMTSKHFLRQQLGPVPTCMDMYVCSCTNSHLPITKQLPCWPDSMQHIQMGSAILLTYIACLQGRHSQRGIIKRCTQWCVHTFVCVYAHTYVTHFYGAGRYKNLMFLSCIMQCAMC